MITEDIIKPEFLSAFRLGVEEGMRRANIRIETCAGPMPELKINLKTQEPNDPEDGETMLCWWFSPQASFEMPDRLSEAMAAHGFKHQFAQRTVPPEGPKFALVIARDGSPSFFDFFFDVPTFFVLDGQGCRFREHVPGLDAEDERVTHVLW